MSSRARRLASPPLVQPFDWLENAGPPDPGLWCDLGAAQAPRQRRPGGAASQVVAANQAEPGHGGPAALDPQAHLAALEREAFTKGYAQGERAGVEAGAKRAEAMLRRLAQTLDELSRLRTTMIRDAERQMVQLALTMARRLVQREISLDSEIVAAMAHVALDRLGDSAPATIRLHPDDYATVMAARGAEWAGTQVTVVPDAAVARGGCVVESAFGLIDASVSAQFAEIERALLGEDVGDLEAGSDAA
jgi:flagellar assembly protein FliH